MSLLFAPSAIAYLHAQDLAPRAYLIAPVNSNAVTVTLGGYHGAIDLAGTIPITGFTGTYYVPVLSYSHAFDLLGRSANLTGSLPYAVGTFSAVGPNGERQVYRSGLVDLSFRFSVNLRGGPAMRANDWVRWKQKVLLGASVKVVAPTGQYDPRRAINWGINRWAIKPEFGYSQRRGSWLLDGYAGVWFFTPNEALFSPSGQVRQTQNPIGSFEGHFSHDFRKMRAWVSLDSNFWFGGTITRNGLLNPATRQTSSRLGGTGSFPVSRYQSIKIAYSYGTYVRYGGNYHQLAVAWQYSWIGQRF